MNLIEANAALDACVFDPENIGFHFNALSDALGLVQFHLVDVTRPEPLFLLSNYSEERVPDYINSGVYLRDPWVEYVVAEPRKAPKWLFDGNVFSRSMKKSNEYYDFCATHDVEHHAFFSLDAKRPGYGLALFRSGRLGEFTTSNRRKMAALTPTIKRVAAYLTEHKLNFAKGNIASIGELGIPAFLMGDSGRVIAHNSAFEEVQDDSLFIKQGQLIGSSAKAQKPILYLNELAKNLISPIVPEDVIIDRPGKLPLILSPQRVKVQGLDILSGASLIVTVKGIDGLDYGAVRMIERVFGLTNAEAEVAFLLCQGSSTEENVSIKTVSPSTVRTQINRLFAKTGTASRVELVSVLNRYLRLV